MKLEDRFKWSGSDFSNCGESCLKGKANENITSRLVYLRSKVEQLTRLLDPSKNDGSLRGGIEISILADQIMGEQFCPPNVSELEHKICVRAFFAKTTIEIERLNRDRILHSADRHELNSDGSQDVRVVGGILDEQAGPKKLQLPFVPTVEGDLNNEWAREGVRERYLISPQFEANRADLPIEPAPEDFVKHTTGKDPQSGKDEVVLQYNPDGTIAKDKKAYATALAEFHRKNRRAKEDFEFLSTKRLEHAKAQAQLARKGSSKPLAPHDKLKDQAGDPLVRIYNQSRMPIVEGAVNALKKHGYSAGIVNGAKSPPATVRAPAAAGAPQTAAATAAPEPSGKEQVPEIKPPTTEKQSINITISAEQDYVDEFVKALPAFPTP